MSNAIVDLKKKLAVLLPELDERQRRLLLAAEANNIGRGGIAIICKITGVSYKTVARGIKEIQGTSQSISGRVRASGSGRKKITEINPEIVDIIKGIVDDDTRGDPESLLQWTCKSVRNISDLLAEHGHEVSRQTVANILHELQFSLQGNRKTKEGKNHPDRDKQFRFIGRLCREFITQKNPVISVDAKKKELVGNFKNTGREWHDKGNPIDVNGHDFPDPDIPRAIPYGVYDVGENQGWVSVGISADTAEFAVASIKYWWKNMRNTTHRHADKILICADSGGSNSYRSHLWKRELQRFANKEGIDISVCHFPPGTSKWN